MKKSSKVLSMVLAVLMAVSCFSGLTIFSASAEETNTKIYFDVSSLPAEWGTTKTVYCHLYAVAGDEIAETSWQGPAEKCKKDTATGLYYYDTKKIKSVDGSEHGGLKDNADYAVIFSTIDSKKAGHQTCNVTLGKPCLGDTIYLTGGKVENTEDSSKMDYAATWKNNSENYGPKAAITSLGNVIDGRYPVYLSRAEMVAQALFNWAVKNAKNYTAETVAKICAQVEAEPMDVYNAYAEMYATQLADPEAYPDCAPLTTIAALLGVDPSATTAEPTTEEPTTEEPTTVEPTTVEPTTEEPTEAPTTEAPTEAPTTEPATEAPTTEPATEAPTTEPATEPVTDPTPETFYVVAGVESLTGYTWVGDPAAAPENVMTKDGDIYTLTYKNVPVAKDYQFKIVENVPGEVVDGVQQWSQNWIGYNGTDNNVTFKVDKECDVTITYNPATKEIGVTGDSAEIVTDMEIDYVVAVGNGVDNWLNGQAWIVDAEQNIMTEVADRVYQITFKDVDSYENYQFKFAANGSWAANWGLPVQDVAPVGNDFDLSFNAQNMIIDTVSLGYVGTVDITITLDLSNFNYLEGTGAKANVKVDGTRVPLLGDADGDYSITVMDATMIQRIAIGFLNIDADSEAFKVCDANEDGRISVKDSTMVQKYAVKGFNNTGNVGSPIDTDAE